MKKAHGAKLPSRRRGRNPLGARRLRPKASEPAEARRGDGDGVVVTLATLRAVEPVEERVDRARERGESD